MLFLAVPKTISAPSKGTIVDSPCPNNKNTQYQYSMRTRAQTNIQLFGKYSYLEIFKYNFWGHSNIEFQVNQSMTPLLYQCAEHVRNFYHIIPQR